MDAATYDVDTSAPMDAATILRALTAKGVSLGCTPRGTIQVSPASGLSAADRALILSHKPELLAELRKREHVNLVNIDSGYIPTAHTTRTPERDVHGELARPNEGHEAFEERAAILEYEGGLSRVEADRVAKLSGEFYQHLFGPGQATGCCHGRSDRYCPEGRRLRNAYYDAAKAAGRLT